VGAVRDEERVVLGLLAVVEAEDEFTPVRPQALQRVRNVVDAEMQD
jgi:hypothetical protein